MRILVGRFCVLCSRSGVGRESERRGSVVQLSPGSTLWSGIPYAECHGVLPLNFQQIVRLVFRPRSLCAIRLRVEVTSGYPIAQRKVADPRPLVLPCLLLAVPLTSNDTPTEDLTGRICTERLPMVGEWTWRGLVCADLGLCHQERRDTSVLADGASDEWKGTERGAKTGSSKPRLNKAPPLPIKRCAWRSVRWREAVLCA